jgi:DNA polymerase-3 subunit delta
MALRPQDLARDLERGLKPVYLISGDELLLVQEACDAIIAAARAAGFEERTLIQGDAGFEWHVLTEQANTLSLFAQRRVLDVRVAAKQLDKDAAAAIDAYLDRADPDTLLLLRCERLDPRQRNSAWFKRIESVGAAMLVWPVGPKEMPGFVKQRAKRAGLEFDRDAIAHLANHVEGNLLAAAQEIDNLALAGLAQPITLDALIGAVADAAHYDAFDLVDAALDGEPARVRHVVWVLRAEGVAALAVLGSLVSQLRRLFSGDSRGLPPQRERAMRAAKTRLRASDVEALLAQAAHVDQRVKGAADGDAWAALESIALRIAGVTALDWIAAADQRAARRAWSGSK